MNDKSWVVLYLGKQQKKINISPDGQRVIIESEQKGKLEYRPFTAKPSVNEELEEDQGQGSLPSKLVPWY